LKALSAVVPAKAGTPLPKASWAPAFAGATVLIAMVFGAAALAQDKAPEKKKTEKKAQKAHKKATPEQIRRFNELEKKQQK
jgi:hypothetical protein